MSIPETVFQAWRAMLEMNATGVLWLQVLAEVHAKSKIHSAFSHEGKTNTCEPSLAPLTFSV